MDFQNEVNKKLDALNKDLQGRLIFKDFAPLSEDDFKNYLTGNSFDTNEFIIYLAEEYADDQRVERALKEHGHDGLIEEFNRLKSDVYAWADNTEPSTDEELVQRIVEFTLRVFLEDLEELAAYEYLLQNPSELEHFEDIEAELTEFLRKHGQDNPIEFNFNEDQKMDTTKIFTVEEFQELLNREDWDHKTSVEKCDRFEENGHAVSFGYVTNVSTLKSENLKIEFTQSYKYSDYQPESFEYGDNGLLPSVSVEGFEVVDEWGNALDDFDIEKLLYSDFTEFEDGGLYKRLDDIEDVGNGPNVERVNRDFLPDLNVHFEGCYRKENQKPDSRYWDYVDLYDLDNHKVLVAVQCHSIYEDVKTSYHSEVFDYADSDKIGEWLSEFLEDTNLIDEVVTEIKSW